MVSNLCSMNRSINTPSDVAEKIADFFDDTSGSGCKVETDTFQFTFSGEEAKEAAYYIRDLLETFEFSTEYSKNGEIHTVSTEEDAHENFLKLVKLLEE